MMTLREYVKQAAKKKDDSACETPGEKIRSKGKGRGAAMGRGRGPLGIPIGEKLRIMEEKEKTSFDLAYEKGAELALNEFIAKTAAKPNWPTKMPQHGGKVTSPAALKAKMTQKPPLKPRLTAKL